MCVCVCVSVVSVVSVCVCVCVVCDFHSISLSLSRHGKERDIFNLALSLHNSGEVSLFLGTQYIHTCNIHHCYISSYSRPYRYLGHSHIVSVKYQEKP